MQTGSYEKGCGFTAPKCPYCGRATAWFMGAYRCFRRYCTRRREKESQQ